MALSQYLYEFIVVRKKSDILFPYQQYRSSADIYQAWKDHFSEQYREEFYVLLLNAKNYLIGYSLISIGSATSTLVHPREVFTAVVHVGACAIILLHNHPTGDPHPSQEDLHITKQIREIGEAMGIPVLDHIIIGDNKYVSFMDDCFWEQTT